MILILKTLRPRKINKALLSKCPYHPCSVIYYPAKWLLSAAVEIFTRTTGYSNNLRRTGILKEKLRHVSQCNVSTGGNLWPVVSCRSKFPCQNLASFRSLLMPRPSITAYLAASDALSYAAKIQSLAVPMNTVGIRSSMTY